MLAVFAGLTLRARCLLAAGFSAILCGMALGETDLIRAGAIAIALPLICVAVVAQAQVMIESARAASSDRVTVGETVDVQLRVANRGLLPIAGLLLDDKLPSVASAQGSPARARFSLGALHPGGTTLVEYPVPVLPRGRFTIGPLSVRLGDPLGMVELVRTFPATTDLVVVPQIVPLPSVPIPGGHEEQGANVVASPGSLGSDDLSVRPYRPGDDLRKIHWRSSARVDELMVRQEQRPWQGEVTVLVDTRSTAHRGSGADSSFEWLVSAAASIAEHLAQNGLRVRLVSDGFARSWLTVGGAESLADLQLDGGRPGSGTNGVRFGASLALDDGGAADTGTFIALVGMPDDDMAPIDADVLARSHGRAKILLGVRSSTWGAAEPESRRARRSRDSSTPRHGHAAPLEDAALAQLAAAGWQVALASRGDSIAQAWSAALDVAGDPRDTGFGLGWAFPASSDILDRAGASADIAATGANR